MRGKLMAGLMASCVLAAGLVEASRAEAEPCLLIRCGGPAPNVVPKLGGQVAPEALPRRRFVSAALRLFLSLRTTDGSHLPALREARVRADRGIAIDATGLPGCGYRTVAASGSRPTRRCRSAVVGSGSAGVQEGDVADRVPIGLFHGRTRNGETILFARALGAVAETKPVLARISITEEGAGRHGSLIRVQVPRLEGGLGSLVHLDLKLRRTFGRGGNSVSLVRARCADGRLRFGVPRMLFRNEADTPGIAPRTIIKGGFAAPCTPRR